MKTIDGFDYVKRISIAVRRRDAVADIKSAKAAKLARRADSDVLIMAAGKRGMEVVREYYGL